MDGFYTKLTSDQTGGSFYDRLADSTVAASGKALWEGQAPEDEALPCAVYQLITATPDSSFEDDNIEAEIQVDIYGESRLGMKSVGQINDQLYALLHRKTLTVSGFNFAQTTVIDRGQRIPEDDEVNRITSRWRLVAA